MHTVSLPEAVAKSVAAFRLFLTFDRRQLERFGDDIPSVWKSFWAPAMMLPLHFVLTVAIDSGGAITAGPVERWLTELTTYAVDVVYWPLAMVLVADLLQKPEHYARYVAAYNWCSIPMAVIAVLLLAIFGVQNGTLGLPGIVLMFWMILFRIILARRVFDVPIAVGVALAAADFMIGQLVLGMRAGILYG